MLAGTIVEPLLNLISRDGQHIQVERQVMLLLLFLVENVDQVVTREELLDNLWSSSFPKDEALTQAVSKLRKALGDSRGNHQSIQTIRKVGYRLIGPVLPIPRPSQDTPNKSPSLTTSPKKWSTIRWATIVLFMVFLLNGVTFRTGKTDLAGRDSSAAKVRVIFASEKPASIIDDSGEAQVFDKTNDQAKHE